jgi:Arc/MetJ-type ribon-helix-helix transcriptional regulator
MKLSVSLPDDDVAVIDRYAEQQGLGTRSGAIQQAVEMLRHELLKADYKAAFEQWAESEDESLWDGVVADGLDRETW